MSNIIDDIVENVEIKQNKNKVVLKWVITIACSAIVIAFTFGQIKNKYLHKFEDYDKGLEKIDVVEDRIIMLEKKAEVNRIEIDTHGKLIDQNREEIKLIEKLYESLRK